MSRFVSDVERLQSAAKALLDGVAPFHSALEVDHDRDGVVLYEDLAEALGLGRDYRPE